MIRRLTWLPALALLLADSLVMAREWRSLDGKRTVEADFMGIRGDAVMLRTSGRITAFPLAALAPEERQFAKNAQAIADAAAKWGPQSFEISLVTEGGWVCRLALPPTKGSPILFTGEMVFLVVSDPAKGKPGDRFEKTLLYGAGGRTYHPLKGEPSPVRAFALNPEEATRVWTETVAQSHGDAARQSPPVFEPEIELVTTRGLGVVVGKSGLVLVDAGLVKDATTLVVHHQGEHYPAKRVVVDDVLGLAVLSCKLPLEPARIGSRKPAVPGQDVYALNVELGSTRKTLAKNPTVTRGIVSRPADATTGAFLHDAKVTPESVGGFILGQKGEVLGVFFNPQSTSRAITARREKAVANPVEALGRSISTSFLAGFLDKLPGAGAPRTSSGTGDMESDSKELMGGALLVVSTKEVKKAREVAAPKTTTPTSTSGGTATGWSLSKSGTRHNAKCRFYSVQSPCAASDGKPCKVCGG